MNLPVGDTQLGYDMRVQGRPWAWAAEAQELEKGLPRVLWKKPENKYFRLCWPSGLSHSYSPTSFVYKAPGCEYTSERGPAPMALQFLLHADICLYTFHVSQNIFLWIFLQRLQNVKSIFSLQAMQK